jgi:6-phosphogluconolactonase
MAPEVLRTNDFVSDAAAFIQGTANDSLDHLGQFRIALSGGNTPAPVYRRWATLAGELPWEKVTITFGDERCVPPNDQQSNYRMARECLFEPAAVPAASVLRMRGEADPKLAAEEYERELKGRTLDSGEKVYRHDLILLGMGDDGHTASLFPGTEALNERQRAVVANFVPKFNSWRLTMTLALLNQARCVCFLIGAAKNPELIDRVIAGDEQYPAARVKPISGRLIWIVGEPA